MIRLLAVAAMPPLLIVLAWENAPEAAIWAGWVIGAGILALGWWRGTLVLKCPYCGKRVKIGAQVCHHCGRTVTNTSAPGFQQPAHPHLADPLAVPRECEHCKSIIRPDATVCAVCRRDISPWSLHDGTWWEKQPNGAVLRLDPLSLEWGSPEDSLTG